MDETEHGSLKLVVATGGESAASDLLRAIANSGEIRQIADGAWVVNTGMEPAELRDRLVTALGTATVFVVEFERWSGAGGAVDAAWLLRRGH